MCIRDRYRADRQASKQAHSRYDLTRERNNLGREEMLLLLLNGMGKQKENKKKRRRRTMREQKEKK